MEKRTKHLTAKLFCLLLLSAVLSACQSDFYDFYEFEQIETNGFDVADARNWFEANAHLIRPSEVLSRSTDGSEEAIALNPVFNWNIAETSRNSEWEVVELPWEYDNVVQIFALAEVWQHAVANNTVPENVIRLVVMQHRVTGKTYGFRMKVAPRLDFLLSHGGNLSNNRLLDRDSRLSGVVLFYTLDGLFVNGGAYQNGEVVAELISKQRLSPEKTNAPATRSGHSCSCREQCFCWLIININSAFPDEENSSGTPWNPPPIPPQSPWSPPPPPPIPPLPPLPPSSPPSPPSNPPPSPPSNPPPSPPSNPPAGGNWWDFVPVAPGSGGGGSGGTGNGPANVMPNTYLVEEHNTQIDNSVPLALRMFNIINVADIWRVENMLNEIMDDCMGLELVNRIANNLGSNNRLNIQFRTGGGSHYDPNTGTIMIDRDTPVTSALLHELIHVYQISRFGINQWSQNALNGEMEAWFAEYLFARRGLSNDAMRMLVKFYNRPFYQSVAVLGDLFDSRGNVRHGYSDRVRGEIESRVLPQFRARHSGQSFNSGLLSNPQQMFPNIQRLSINC